MALFNRDENKTRPLSSFTAEPSSEPTDKTPKESESDDKNGKTPAAPPTREKPGKELPDREGVRPSDSSVIDVDARLKSLARQIAGSKKKLVANVLQIGQSLTEAQDLLASHHGGAFGKWVKQSCGFSKRTAYNYMGAHLTFGSCATVAQRRFELSTMYLLASDSTPSAAVTEAIDLAESGETVTGKTAKQLIAKHGDGKPARKVSTRPDPVMYDDPEAIITVHAKHPGVDHAQALARVFKKIMADRKASEAA